MPQVGSRYWESRNAPEKTWTTSDSVEIQLTWNLRSRRTFSQFRRQVLWTLLLLRAIDIWRNRRAAKRGQLRTVVREGIDEQWSGYGPRKIVVCIVSRLLAMYTLRKAAASAMLFSRAAWPAALGCVNIVLCDNLIFFDVTTHKLRPPSKQQIPRLR